MTTDARMIGINQDSNSAATIDLDIGWVRVMEDLGFKPRTADVGGPLLSTVSVLSYVEAARINRAFKAQGTGELADSRDSVPHTDRDELDEMVE